MEKHYVITQTKLELVFEALEKALATNDIFIIRVHNEVAGILMGNSPNYIESDEFDPLLRQVDNLNDVIKTDFGKEMIEHLRGMILAWRHRICGHKDEN